MKLFIVTAIFTFTTFFVGNSLANSVIQSDTTIIYLSDFGFKKTRDKDCVKKLYKALETVKGNNPKKLIFPRGEYHFYPEHTERRYYSESNSTDENPRKCALLFENVQNIPSFF